MRRHLLLLFSISALVVSQVAQTESSTTPTASTCPFTTPRALLLVEQHALNPLEALRARQAISTSTGTCPTDYFGCSNLGAPQACCTSTAICTTDQENHVACCASGATCTGIIGGSSGGSTTSFTTSSETNGGSTTTTTQGSNTGGTALASNSVIIVTAGSAITNGAKAGIEANCLLLLFVGILDLTLWL